MHFAWNSCWVVVVLQYYVSIHDGRHCLGGSFTPLTVGKCSSANQFAITRSVPFFLSGVHLVSSSTRANVFQLPRMVGSRTAPDLYRGGSSASMPSFSSNLLRCVVCGMMLTICRVCHLRTKSCANRNRWAALTSTTTCETG